MWSALHCWLTLTGYQLVICNLCCFVLFNSSCTLICLSICIERDHYPREGPAVRQIDEVIKDRLDIASINKEGSAALSSSDSSSQYESRLLQTSWYRFCLMPIHLRKCSMLVRATTSCKFGMKNTCHLFVVGNDSIALPNHSSSLH